MLSEREPRQITIKNLPGKEVDLIVKMSKKIPMYPCSAVDRWGFVAEDKNRIHHNGKELAKVLHRFNVWGKSFSEYEIGIKNFSNRFCLATMGLLKERKGDAVNDGQEHDFHLNLINLSDSWKALDSMQKEFDKHFVGLVDEKKLVDLKRNESSNFKHLWTVTFAMKCLRDAAISNLGVIVERRIDKKKQEFLKNLQY